MNALSFCDHIKKLISALIKESVKYANVFQIINPRIIKPSVINIFLISFYFKSCILIS